MAVRRMGGRVGVLTAAFLAAYAVLASPGMAGAAGEVCVAETYNWSGTGQLGSVADTVSTGVLIATQVGTRLAVIGVSADGLDNTGQAWALQVSVGTDAATAGAVIAGGEIAVHGNGVEVEVRGVTVVVERCAQVESAGIPTTTAPSTPTPGLDVPGGPTGGLPGTGGPVAPWVLLGLASTSAGLLALRFAGRPRRI